MMVVPGGSGVEQDWGRDGPTNTTDRLVDFGRKKGRKRLGSVIASCIDIFFADWRTYSVVFFVFGCSIRKTVGLFGHTSAWYFSKLLSSAVVFSFLSSVFLRGKKFRLAVVVVVQVVVCSLPI